MTLKDIKAIVAKHVATSRQFDNQHGITTENLADFLVEPYSVAVDPDDLETGP